jgi:hypothetical protein
MLKVYTGYNLSSIRDAVSFNFTDLTTPKEIIESVTEKVLSTDCFSDNGVELKVKTNHPLVLGVLETLAMESGNNQNLIYYYIDEFGVYTSSYYEGEVVIGEYFPNKELTDLKSRFYSYYYKNIRRLGRGD